MIGVFVEHDLVGVPVPIGAVAKVGGRDAEIKTSEPETVGAAAFDAENVLRTEAAAEVSVFPGMIQVKARIIAAGIVADPLPIGMDVGSIRVFGHIAVIVLLSGLLLTRRFAGLRLSGLCLSRL